jgi:NAD(P)-dependent dehydrogenase (short-subunit alcohol dehydrogenase family)
MSRVVLITGCSSGFGQAMVPAFAKRGWRVVAGVRGGGQLADAEVIDLDVTNGEDRRRAAAALDRVDCLVNNAGWALFGAFEESSEEEIRAQLETNLVAAMLLTKALLPQLRASRGRIVNVSSVMGYFGFPMMSVYAASKFALEGWSESLRHELRPHGVEVALVEPGGHRTRFAENARWPAAPMDVYARQRERFRALRQSLLSRPALPPEAVAERIAEMASSPKPMPLRLRVGRDALAAWLLRKLPSRLAEAAAARAVERSLS